MKKKKAKKPLQECLLKYGTQSVAKENNTNINDYNQGFLLMEV
jgi:hypothetical protein